MIAFNNRINEQESVDTVENTSPAIHEIQVATREKISRIEGIASYIGDLGIMLTKSMGVLANKTAEAAKIASNSLPVAANATGHILRNTLDSLAAVIKGFQKKPLPKNSSL